MGYQDTWAVCTKCGKQFVFRIEDQRKQAQRGEQITPPALCPACQAQPRGEYQAREYQDREYQDRPRREARPRPRPERKPAAPPVLGPGPHEGTVKWYDTEKGYGFITQQNGDEIFFHRTGVAPGERPFFPDGTEVTYMIEETEKGPQAVEVARMDAENSA